MSLLYSTQRELLGVRFPEGPLITRDQSQIVCDREEYETAPFTPINYEYRIGPSDNTEVAVTIDARRILAMCYDGDMAWEDFVEGDLKYS